MKAEIARTANALIELFNRCAKTEVVFVDMVLSRIAVGRRYSDEEIKKLDLSEAENED